jgi:putative membrane protein insertion efficiency factor
VAGDRESDVKALLQAAIRAYRFLLSPMLGSNCRYHPSCSAYALEAIETHGALSGSWLALRRIGRCHPWGGMGHDPVPGARRA